MATRAPSTEQAPSTGPLIGETASGSSLLGSSPLRIEPGRGLFTICISPAVLGCRDGVIVPLPVPAWHQPGVDANIHGDQGQGYISSLRRQGYVEIPHRRPCVAFGEKRKSPPYQSAYLRRIDGADSNGRRATKWVDAWMRPQQLAHLTIWDNDKKGRNTFLHEALIDLANEGRPLSDVQITLATQPLINRILDEAKQETARSRTLIAEMAANLPEEHTPDVVREIIERIAPGRKAPK